MDRREAILARLPEIAQLVTTIDTIKRNTNEFSDLSRPAIVSLDGDEEQSDRDSESRPPNAPRRMTLKAQLVVLASGMPETIGTTINGLRVKLLKGIVSDAQLIALVLDGAKRQSIRYEGATLTMGSGRQIEAELRLDFAFTYALRFDEL